MTLKARRLLYTPSEEPWTKADDKVLRKLIKWGWSYREIGQALDRTRLAVAGKIARLGLKRPEAPKLREIG